MTLFRLTPSILLVSLCAAAAFAGPGDKGLESVHQPVVSATGASVPGCGDWTHVSRDSVATTDLNFGCAVNGNLAAMIADPQDLLRGKTTGDVNGETASRAYKVWYETPPTGTQPIEKVNSRSGGQ